MDFGEWISRLPLWAVFVLTLAICLGAVEAGAALAGFVLRGKNEKEPEAPLGSVVGAMLGLLAFILAFTFGLTAARFEARKQLVLDEANAIGTTYLRAGLLPPTQGLEVRRMLREYADIRLNTTVENIHETRKKSAEIHGRLWSQAKSLVQADMDSEVRSLFIASLNELIDLHQSRLTVGWQYRIPGTVWLVVYLLIGAVDAVRGISSPHGGNAADARHAGAGGGVLAGDSADCRHRPSGRGADARESATDCRRAADDAPRFAVKCRADRKAIRLELVEGNPD